VDRGAGARLGALGEGDGQHLVERVHEVEAQRLLGVLGHVFEVYPLHEAV
jgi:hypothetical protein